MNPNLQKIRAGTTNRNNITVDKKSGRITSSYSDRKSIECFLMPIEAYYGLAEELFRIFGDDYWYIMQKAGEGVGSIAAKSFPKRTLELTKAIKIGFNGSSQWGFGRYELKEIDIQNGRVVFELHDSVFEYCVESNKKFVEEQYFLIGFYKRFYSVIFDKEVYCKYSRFINNDRPYYRFEVMVRYH